MAKSPLVLTLFDIQIQSTKYVTRGIIRHHRLPVPKTLMNRMTSTLTIVYDFNISVIKFIWIDCNTLDRKGQHMLEIFCH